MGEDSLHQRRAQLDALEEVEAAARQLEEVSKRVRGELDQAVRAARDLGLSWSAIAKAAGMSRQALIERYQRPPSPYLSRAKAAARLGMSVEALPDLGREWTKAEVRKLMVERPDWFLEAQRRHEEQKKAEREAHRRETLARAQQILDAKGFPREDSDHVRMKRVVDDAFDALLAAGIDDEDLIWKAIEERWPDGWLTAKHIQVLDAVDADPSEYPEGYFEDEDEPSEREG